MAFDEKKIEDGVRLILEGIGEDPSRGGLKDTPSRVARMYREICGGIDVDPETLVTVVEGADFDEIASVSSLSVKLRKTIVRAVCFFSSN